MTRKNDLQPGPDLADLVAMGLAQLESPPGPASASPPPRWLLVDVAGQRLALVQGRTVAQVKRVSTALVGLDCRQDSGGTPAGLHRIHEKVGAGSPWGTQFLGRKPTGRVWAPGLDESGDDDLILTRILTLDGQEDGVNRGEGVDSLARYIYIHGTNYEDEVGTPVSHGCIRMTNDDVRELFDQVEVGDPVLIL